MENWVLTVIAMEPKLKYAADMYTKRASEAALEMTGDACTAIQRVVEINDMKRRIVNMKVLFDAIKGALSDEELLLLREYAVHSAAEIAARQNAARSGIYRKIAKAQKAAVKALSRLKYDKEKMDEDYLSMQLTLRAYRQIARRKRKESGGAQNIAACTRQYIQGAKESAFTSV